MIVPKALLKGDTIGLLSASGATPPEKLAPAIAELVDEILYGMPVQIIEELENDWLYVRHCLSL
ncbi:hypothetical protein LSPH24S_08931 [Lysinibacillus sphaericus]